jgi:hypothetical protein
MSTETDETLNRPTMNGGHDPSELARLRWQKQRARDAAEAAGDKNELSVDDATQNVVVRTTLATGQIMKALEKAAKKGDVRAAAELRNWMRGTLIETDTSIASLDRRVQQEVLARVLAEIEADEGALPDGPLEHDTASDPPVASL